MQKGNISVQAENIFPIIKKFLYSDHEIFLRELISNATDATSKLKALASKGELKDELGSLLIEVIINADAKTLTIRDRGIGMNEEEIKKYLNQMAFSSAQEFLDKYKDESIIGHFGLGFYSAFMVSDRVEVLSKSYDGSPAVKWTCKGDPSFTLEEIEKEDRGTDVVLHIAKDSEEFLEEGRISALLDKYCKFLPFPIKFGTKTETSYEGEGDDRKEIKTEVDNIINNPNPLWKSAPSELKDEDYKAFYKELHPFSPDPLFWIHLNIDYPFNLTGILYFPKISNSIELQRNKIALYSNQVYITDDVKEIVPEFLTLLHGVIDSPDIPLNVSRSYLQADTNVKKISSYITKKVADKLKSLFKKDRDAFTSKWDEIGLFVKYGMVTDDKFYEKALKFALLKNTEAEYFTVEEYEAKVKDAQTDKHDRLVYLYTNNPNQHDSYVKAARAKGYDVLVLDQIVDNHFIQQLETKLEKVSFKRVDADTVDLLIEKDENIESVLTEKEKEKVKDLFLKTLSLEEHRLKVKALDPSDMPILITRPEFMRRMTEMQSTMGMGLSGDNMPDVTEVIVNTNHPLVAKKLLRMKKGAKRDRFVSYLYDLARLNQNMLGGGDLTAFINKSIEFVEK